MYIIDVQISTFCLSPVAGEVTGGGLVGGPVGRQGPGGLGLGGPGLGGRGPGGLWPEYWKNINIFGYLETQSDLDSMVSAVSVVLVQGLLQDQGV